MLPVKAVFTFGNERLNQRVEKKREKVLHFAGQFPPNTLSFGPLSLSLSDFVPGIFFHSIFVFPKCLNPSYSVLTLKGHLRASQVFRSLFICSVKFKSSHFLSIVATFPLSSPVCLKSIHHGGSQECSIKVDSCSEVLLQP